MSAADKWQIPQLADTKIYSSTKFFAFSHVQSCVDDLTNRIKTVACKSMKQSLVNSIVAQTHTGTACCTPSGSVPRS